MLAGLAWLLCGGASWGAHADPAPVGADRPVRLTVEFVWSTPAGGTNEAVGVDLEVPEGRVLEAVAWPGGQGGADEPAETAGNIWRLGGERAGRVRARVEAPVGASLMLRAGGQVMRFPLPLVLEGAQRTPPQSPVEITVERVSWDVVGVSLGREPEGSHGVAAPGERVPVTVGFNVLTPEQGEVALRCSAELRPVRGGDPVWRTEIREVVPTNTLTPATFSLPVQAPEAEGTYVLEFRATWDPAPAHDRNKLIGRLIRRGTRGLFGTAAASRRVTLAVLDPARLPPPPPFPHDQDVDTIDLSRARGHRPTASGRAPAEDSGWSVPEEALAEATRRDLLRGWIARAGSEVASLGPADAAGLAWSAVGLRVTHPGRPHRLTLKVAGGHPAAVGVALVGVGPAPGPGAGTGARPRVLLDACASGPPVPADGPAATFSWLVWPGTTDPVLVLSNRSKAGPVQVGTVTLTELAEVPRGPAVEEPAGAPARSLGLYLNGPDLLERFGAAVDPGLADVLGASKNLVAYLGYCGASAVTLPEGLADRARRGALDGTAAEDAVGPDRLDLALRVLASRRVAAWLELSFAGALPGLPAPGAPEALARGLVRVDRRGLADGPEYHPLSAEVREAMRRRVAGAVAAHEGRARLAGVLVRLGPGPTLLGGPDTGFDDATYARFVREAFDPETARGGVPGLAGDDPGRFEARSKFLAGSGRTPWLSWRSGRVAALYAELAEAARGASPGAALAVATPPPGDGPVGTEARRADQAGLAPSLAWRAVGLDLDAWPSGESAPVVLRGVGLGPDDLARDLATHPELDAKVASRPARGLLLDAAPAPAPAQSAVRSAAGRRAVAAVGLTLSAPAAGGDEALGHALAALDPGWVWVAPAAVAGHEEGLRRFARVFRALPSAPPAERRPLAFGVSVRSYRAGGQTYLALANDTPYPVCLDTVLAGTANAPVYDFARSALLRPRADAAGRHLVLDLLPFAASAVRVGAADVRVAAATTYPSEAVLTGIRARHSALSEQLSRLTSGGEKEKPGTGPPNPGFEPDATPPDPPPLRIGAAAVVPTGAAAPGGWKAAGGGAGGGLVIDPTRPHSGRGALRLDAPAPPAAAVSDDFSPHAHALIVVRAWLRADRPDARVRVWIEGESAGKPYQRVSELSVPAGWAERAVRASDVPAAGLDPVRLRFELLTPGSLWVDDLSVTGEALSGPERRNALVALLAASQAFREKRYADFARLAGSHWVRPPGSADGGPEGPAADRSALIRTGDASALPPGRRLR